MNKIILNPLFFALQKKASDSLLEDIPVADIDLSVPLHVPGMFSYSTVVSWRSVLYGRPLVPLGENI